MKTRFLFRWIALPFVVLLLCACQKDPFLTLDGASDLVIEATGGSATLTFTTNQDWSVRADSWIHVEPSSGTASNRPVTVTVSADANTSSADRSGSLAITAGEMLQSATVTQEAVYFRFMLGDREVPSQVILDQNGALTSEAGYMSVETNVKTDVSTWSVTCSEEWCYYTLSNNGTSANIYLSADPYGKYDPLWPRSCDFRVVIPGFCDKTIKVVQESVTYIQLTVEMEDEFILSPSGAPKDFTIHTNMYEWKIENANEWLKAEKSDAMTLRVSVIPRTSASASRKGTIYLYSSALSERPASFGGVMLTLNFKEGDPDMSGEDYGYGGGHGWD